MNHDLSSVYKTEPARYSPEDFLIWEEKELLQLSPKFQRRPVWKTPAKSYLIDTMLRGMTIPPLYIRMAQHPTKPKTVREVVDGQQRVRTALDFVADKFRLSKTLEGPWKGKRFSQLSGDEQARIKNYSFSFEIFKGISDQEVLEVFCRLNMNGVPLNDQELRNGKFFGLFKQSCYRLARNYLEFWRRHKVFTEQNIARMMEVELTSELVIAGIDGMQDKKKSINSYYRDCEETYPDMHKNEGRFRDTMAEISETFEAGLGGSAFHRPPLFYTLYSVVYHHRFGLPKIQRKSPKRPLKPDERDELREAVEKLSGILTQAKEDKAYVPPKRYAEWVASSARQTDNILPRKSRFDSLYDEAF